MARPFDDFEEFIRRVSGPVNAAVKSGSDYVGGAFDVARGGAYLPIAAARDTYNQIATTGKQAITKGIGAVAGLKPPEIPNYGSPETWAALEILKTGSNKIGGQVVEAGKSVGGLARQGLLGVGFTEPAKAPAVMASSTPAPVVQQPTKPQVMTPPALAAVPALNQAPADVPLPAVMNDLPPNSLRPSDLGRPAPLSFDGNTLTSINPNREVRPSVAPAVNEWTSDQYKIPEGRRTNEAAGNPNEAKLSDLMDRLTKITGEAPRVGRNTELNAISDAIKTIAPLTSYGQYGATQTQAETTKRGQDITARGQDIAALTAEKGHKSAAEIAGMDIGARKDYYGSMADKYRADTMSTINQNKPDVLEAQAAKSYLDAQNEYFKSDMVISDISSKATPEEQTMAVENHKRIFEQTHPMPGIVKRSLESQAFKEGDTRTVNVAGKPTKYVVKNGKWAKE
jgi:hypothetical protein